MADHPRPCGRKALGAAAGFLDQPRRPGRTAAAARPMRRLVLVDGPGCIGAALVGGMRLALVRGHAEEVRRRQDHARRFALASRTVLRCIAFCHRPHIRKRSAIATEIFINRHFCFLSPASQTQRRMRGGRYAPSRTPSQGDYLSCESGIWMSPLICLIGPADDGMTSKSKISVGSHSVAQALGTSTTPEMWPWHGAVPRIE